jgi:hypothetical protein
MKSPAPSDARPGSPSLGRNVIGWIPFDLNRKFSWPPTAASDATHPFNRPGERLIACARHAGLMSARAADSVEGTMQFLLVILVGLAVGCGVAAGITISMAPGADERGYENPGPKPAGSKPDQLG